MAILEITDFNSYDEVEIKLTSTPEEIIDERVQVYWDDLAKWVGVSPEDLPSEPNIKVKDYLICYVASIVASKNTGSNLNQISDNIVVDQWNNRYNLWDSRRQKLRADIQTSDVIDPTKLESDTETKNSMLTTWKKG